MKDKLLIFFFLGFSIAAFAQNTPKTQSEKIVLANAQFSLTVEKNSGIWNATWSNNTFINDVNFLVEINGVQNILGTPETRVNAFNDALGKGQEVRQVWRNNGFRVEREIRLYGEKNLITLGGRIINETNKDGRLGTTQLLQSERWKLGNVDEVPAAIHQPKLFQTSVIPFQKISEQNYQGTGILSFFNRNLNAGLTIGYVRADEVRPDLTAKFKASFGGT